MQWKGISKAVWKVKRLHRNPSEYRNTKHHPILSWERLSYPVWIFFFLSRKPISSKIIRFKLSHHFSGISSLAPPKKRLRRFKSWPNELARRCKSTQVYDQRPTCVSFGNPLVLTLVELKFVRKSTQIFPRLATQRKSTQVDCKSTVYAWNLRLIATSVNLRADLRIRLDTHRKSVRKSLFAILHRLESPFCQRLKCQYVTF